MAAYPSDDQLRRGIEAMFFAYRAFTADPDQILAEMDLGRAHHRALHFIARRPGMTVSALLGVLGITKQSLNRVLRRLVADGLVAMQVGPQDRRERLLVLTAPGAALEARLSGVQRARMRAAYAAAGPEAVAGFHRVLEAMMDPPGHEQFAALRGDRAWARICWSSTTTPASAPCCNAFWCARAIWSAPPPMRGGRGRC